MGLLTSHLKCLDYYLLFAPENVFFFPDGSQNYFLPVNKVHEYVAM